MNRVTNLNEAALQRAQDKLRDLIAAAEAGEERLRGTDLGGRLAKTIAEAKKLLPENREPETKEPPTC